MFRLPLIKSFLIFCSAILFLSSCEEITNEFGSDLQLDDVLLQTLYTDTITVKTEIIQFDSVNTSTISRLLIGSVEDPVLGTYSAESYIKFIVGKDSIDFRDSDDREPIYDSLVFSLSINYEYGDTLLTQNLKIEQLDEEIIDSVNYYQFSSLPVKANSVLGTATYPDGLDSLKTLRFKLDDTFGAAILAEGSNGNLFTKARFAEMLKGVKISSDRQDGIMLGADLGDFTSTFLKLYYHYQDDTVATNQNFFFFRRFHSIKSDLSGTVLENLSPQNSLPSNLANNLCVVQAGLGITTHITFPYLEAFDDFAKQSGASVAIHRVELYLVPDLEKTSSILTPPASLLLLNADQDGNPDITRPLVNEIGRDNVTLVYNDAARVYNEQGSFSSPNALLTSYVARIVELDKENYGLFLGVNQNNSSVNRLIFNDNQSFVDKKLALRIYYTLVK